MYMQNEITIYKAKKANASAGIFILILIFFGLTLPTILSGDLLARREIIGQAGFWILGIILTLIPLGGRFEVGKDYIKSYLFGICIDTLKRSEIETIKYGRIKRWGVVGMGNGLMGWKRNSRGGRSYFSFSESGYGKEAILHAKHALEGI